MKKLLSCLACGALAVSLLCAAPLMKADASEAFDENHIVLAFGSLSDPHIGYGTNHVNLDRALKKLKSESSRPLDALYFHGDQTQGSQTSEDKGTEHARSVQRDQMRQFIGILQDNFDLNKTAAIITNGNHDTYWDGNKPKDFYEVYNEASHGLVYQFDTDTSPKENGDRDVLVCGYHFLSVEITSYRGSNSIGPIASDTEVWLKETLDRITSENPNQYVFVSAHAVVPNTVGGSSTAVWEDTGKAKEWGDWGGTVELQHFFEENNYPQVILFSGHTHYNVNEDDAIMQLNGMTYLQGGSTADACSEAGYENSYGGDRSEGQGMLLEVDANGNIRITRYDFTRGEQIKSPWYLKAPQTDKSHLTSYTREGRAQKPVFTDEDKRTATVREISSSTIEVVYPLGQHPDMVADHIITVKGGNGAVLATKKILTPFRYYPQPSGMPKSYTATFSKLAYSYPYRVEIVAYDSYGTASDPLVIEMRDMTEEYERLAEELDGRIALLKDKTLSEADGTEIAAIRTEFANASYRVRELMKNADAFGEIEAKYYNDFRLNPDAAKYEPEASGTYSIASTASKGSFADSALTGITMNWKSASKNNSIGFTTAYRLDGLHIGFANLKISSEHKKIGIVLSNTMKDRWLEGEPFLLYVDFATGDLFVNADVRIGRSENLVLEKLGVTPFDLRFTMKGTPTLSVHTLLGDETFEIPEAQIKDLPHLSDYDSCYLSITPWDSTTTASLDVVCIHGGGESCAQYPGTTDPGTTDPGTTDPGTTDPGTTDPGTTDPGTTDPGTTEPGTTEPGTTEPGTNEPAADDEGCGGVITGGAFGVLGIAALGIVFLRRKRK